VLGHRGRRLPASIRHADQGGATRGYVYT
jgi:hypothetical protein